MEIVIGTYEGPIISYAAKLTDDINFEAQFVDKSHSGCVKSVACNNRYLATGSSDESIRLLDLHKRVELGALMQHSGTVNCLSFHGSHLLSGSDDGTICVYQCGTWECLKILKSHTAAVTQLSVHPSGVLALSVSRDKTLKTWSLITGKPVHTVNLQTIPDSVIWNTDGSSYAILSDKEILVFQPHSGKPVRNYSSPKRIVACKFLSPTLLVYGGECKDITAVEIETNSVQTLTGHVSRVKSLDFVRSDVKDHYLLISVASDGDIKIWALSQDSHELIGGTTLNNNRPVCMCVYTGEKKYVKQMTTPAPTLKHQVVKKPKKRIKRKVLFANIHAIRGGKSITRKLKHKKRNRIIPLALEH
ncbi:p21-activated protein kinase-interacting protein 1-like [Bolinopsis microptera]|uniref:p21-activated protein kinase-interacting protein 1-like n=1 Tax=Bolinopsis microptera TaxID=2820187 RepID=UPI00307A4FF9